MNQAINTFINENLPSLVIDKTVDDIVSFIIALNQYIQLGNMWILDNNLINNVYKSKRLYKNIDNVTIKNIKEITNFFEKCEEMNEHKIFQSSYVIKRINYVLELLLKKFVIFQCKDDKSPKTIRWNKSKFNDTIKHFLEQEIEFTNIGVLCGKESGIIVIDIDTKDHGMEYWEEMLKEYNNGNDIDTLITITGSKGKHYYFKYTDNMSAWFSTNKMFTKEKVIGANLETNVNNALSKYNKIGIDFRSRNGFVIVPPSIHLKCETIYDFNDINKEISTIPNWLFEIIDDYFVKRNERLSQLALLNDKEQINTKAMQEK